MTAGFWVILQAVAVHAAIQPPPWADPELNPCSSQPGGWLKLYWPQDGQCYRIFQKGAPCPATMELSPGANGAECRCPPGHVQLHEDSTCYRIFTRGPCSKGQFLAPVQDNNKGRWGVCTDLQECLSAGDLFWPENRHCYQQFSRGPCPNGQLLLLNNSTGLPECGCNDSGPLARFFWPPTKTCHQFYTRGPCLEKGTLYLPGPLCACHSGLSNYYKATGQCYEIGTTGPCKSGQVFTRSGCMCKPDYVPWADGHCYRLFTKGPCQQDQLVALEGTCKPLPCPRGKLYFPEEDACHRVGVQGPCAKGQLVLFEQAVRPAIEGISYKGMCGCAKGACQADQIESRQSQKKRGTQVDGYMDYATARLCVTTAETKICHQLYTQGPCEQGEWLVPGRQGRSKRTARTKKIPTSVGVYMAHRFQGAIGEPMSQPPPTVPTLYQETRTKWRCECKPGYSPSTEGKGCKLPLVALAKYLNGQDFFS